MLALLAVQVQVQVQVQGGLENMNNIVHYKGQHILLH